MNKENTKFNSQSVKAFALFFFSLLILHIVLDNLDSTLRFFTKPLLLISLLAFFIKQSTHLEKPTRNGMMAALLFSLFGDIFLMFVSQSSHFFTAGLAAFLIAHIMYIVVFLKRRNPRIPFYIFTTILLTYAIALFYLIEDNLGSMFLPVILYIAIILSMATTAFIRKKRVTKISYLLVLFGALFFLLSDSLLALNKFYKPILYPQVSIMLTYGLAQFLITLGILKQEH